MESKFCSHTPPPPSSSSRSTLDSSESTSTNSVIFADVVASLPSGSGVTEVSGRDVRESHTTWEGDGCHHPTFLSISHRCLVTAR
ncbi:unnamed protein product [Taenia asiatica]|uniref:Uncharacterized protein n=1 Tax=Taenia asiatica TaxID=60517 RepID=A0A3P6Q5C1_TAEAS|nr:unnamed protein product [Taenia asiatica]